MYSLIRSSLEIIRQFGSLGSGRTADEVPPRAPHY